MAKAPFTIESFEKFRETEINKIEPRGWLQRYLEIQRDGLTGHLEAAGFPYDTHLWAGESIEMKHGEPWWPYEQTAYWIDGMTRCGYLLDDAGLIERSHEQINYVLEHADNDGYLGPKSCKEPMHAGRWSHMIFFRAMLAHYSATGDKRVLPALAKHYLSKTSDHSGHRDVCNVEIMLNVYAKTGKKKLLEMAEHAFETYTTSGVDPDLTYDGLKPSKPATEHGVTFCETFKLGAILYLYTGKEKYLQASINGYKKLERHHMLIDGVPSSSERLRGCTALDAHETCDITDYTWSAGYLLMATGKSIYADRIERACLNAAPGAVTSDFKALQYFSSLNQIVATNNSCHTLQSAGGKWMSYRPKPGTECCTAQVNRIIPNYIARMWMQKGTSDFYAVLYGPNTFRSHIEKNEFEIIEETNYPFSERIDFRIRCKQAVPFTLHLRIPGWCDNAQLHINGKPINKSLKSGSFFPLDRTFENNDRISLRLPMKLHLVQCDGGFGIERGPLLYALRLSERWEIDKNDPNSTKEFPAWNCYPESPWNYALAVKEQSLERDIEVVHRPLVPEPWTPEGTPIELHVPARRVKGWKLKRAKRIAKEKFFMNEPGNFYGGWTHKLVLERGDFILTPPLPSSLENRLSEKVEKITLVPYGCTHLRIALFPKA